MYVWVAGPFGIENVEKGKQQKNWKVRKARRKCREGRKEATKDGQELRVPSRSSQGLHMGKICKEYYTIICSIP